MQAITTGELQRLGRAVAGLRFENLPETVIRRAKQRVLDTIGCLVAGYEAGISASIRTYVLAQGGAPQATLLPYGERTTAALAGLAHSSYIHGLELSDVVPRGSIHPGNEILPAAFAIAEREAIGGKRIIPALIAGYEVETRFGQTVFPNAMYRGWWTPGAFGAIGTAVTAGHLLGLDGDGIANALGIVVNLMPSCMLQAHHEGESVKWLMGGQTCAAGLLAAEMAARGVTGMRDVAKGLLPVMADKHDVRVLVDGLGDDGMFVADTLLQGIVTKYYATVGPASGPLDSLFHLVEKHDVRAEDVEEIELVCMTRAATFFGDPCPQNDISARASIPYCLAAALWTGDRGSLLGPAFREDMLRNEAVRSTAGKVRIVMSEEYEKQYPERSLARLKLRLRDGREYVDERDRHADPRYTSPTDEAIEGKFRLIADGVLGEARSTRVIELVRRFESLPRLEGLIEVMTIETTGSKSARHAPLAAAPTPSAA